MVTVKELEEFLSKVKDKNKQIYFYTQNDIPFDDGVGIENAFEVSMDAYNTGVYDGVYLKGII